MLGFEMLILCLNVKHLFTNTKDCTAKLDNKNRDLTHYQTYYYFNIQSVRKYKKHRGLSHSFLHISGHGVLAQGNEWGLCLTRCTGYYHTAGSI